MSLYQYRLASYNKPTELTRDANNKGLAWSSVVECFLGSTANTTNNISIIIALLLTVIVWQETGGEKEYIWSHYTVSSSFCKHKAVPKVTSDLCFQRVRAEGRHHK